MRLCLYGSTPLMLMGQEDRSSLDIDVAAPYSSANERTLTEAAKQIGLPLNPADDYEGDHIEWVGPLRLCLASPEENSMILWQGSRVTAFTLPIPDLIASRLIRYDPTDQADIQFMLVHQPVSIEDISQAVTRLPAAFREDALVQENLKNLQRDLPRWLP
jgi:hypothetical protein